MLFIGLARCNHDERPSRCQSSLIEISLTVLWSSTRDVPVAKAISERKSTWALELCTNRPSRQ
jgi:hypothetical protein